MNNKPSEYTMSTNTTFLSTLHELMVENGLSVRKLSKLSGVATATIQRLKSGESTPHPATIAKLAAALAVDPKVLWVASATDARDDDYRAEMAYEKHLQELRGQGNIFHGAHAETLMREIPILALSQTADYFCTPGFSNCEFIALPPEMLYTTNVPTPDFAIVAETAAMAPAVQDGDALYFCKEWPRIKSGQIVLAETENNSAIIGRFKRDISEMFLSFDNNSEFNIPSVKIKKVLAVCVGLYRPFF